MDKEEEKILILAVALDTILSIYAFDDCFLPTGLDSRWKRRCKRKQFVSALDSSYQKKCSDRTWKICCRNLPIPKMDQALIKCSNWTGYVNPYGGVLNFVCPGEGYVAGIRSVHSNEREDRMFRFKCCSVTGYIMDNCKTSGIVNAFNRRATYSIQEGRVLNGMGGIFRDHYKDRLFEYQDCLMKKRG